MVLSSAPLRVRRRLPLTGLAGEAGLLRRSHRCASVSPGGPTLCAAEPGPHGPLSRPLSGSRAGGGYQEARSDVWGRPPHNLRQSGVPPHVHRDGTPLRLLGGGERKGDPTRSRPHVKVSGDQGAAPPVGHLLPAVRVPGLSPKEPGASYFPWPLGPDRPREPWPAHPPPGGSWNWR